MIISLSYRTIEKKQRRGKRREKEDLIAMKDMHD